MKKVERVLKDEIAIARLEIDKEKTINNIEETSSQIEILESKVRKMEASADFLVESYPSRDDPRLTSAIGVPPRFRDRERFLTPSEEHFAMESYSGANKIKTTQISPLKKSLHGLNRHLSMLKFKKASALTKRAFHMAFPGSLESLEAEIRFLLKDIEKQLLTEKSVLKIAENDIAAVQESIARAKTLIAASKNIKPENLELFAKTNGYGSYNDILVDAHDDVNADISAMEEIRKNIAELELTYQIHLRALNNILERKNKENESQKGNN
ncbi:MAG: hypothetical protein IJ538_00670 [Clostridia bacterium]|nr:hypothetical protein [Clostridia bacterium]